MWTLTGNVTSRGRCVRVRRDAPAPTRDDSAACTGPHGLRQAVTPSLGPPLSPSLCLSEQMLKGLLYRISSTALPTQYEVHCEKKKRRERRGRRGRKGLLMPLSLYYFIYYY